MATTLDIIILYYLGTPAFICLFVLAFVVVVESSCLAPLFIWKIKACLPGEIWLHHPPGSQFHTLHHFLGASPTPALRFAWRSVDMMLCRWHTVVYQCCFQSVEAHVSRMPSSCLPTEAHVLCMPSSCSPTKLHSHTLCCCFESQTFLFLKKRLVS